ncbi:hypothetical protein N0V90_001855 [Kalmusia sp. IMI 367209]|nr:hypothetical protein N0V90_001855 [Kalmusia sp. IMI 367209]
MSIQARDSNGLNAYATLLTRPSYLAGALLLAYTLHQYSPSTPLIILYTPETLSGPSVNALHAEAKHSNTILYPVDHLRLAESKEDDGVHGMVAERFIDTWTKLRVFEILEVRGQKVDRLCFLDADMMIFKDPSPYIFNEKNDEYLASDSGNRMCASHICVCNLDHDAWAPSSWTPQNCAHTHVSSPDDIAEVKSEPDTMGQMNTGTFVFHPSPTLRSFVLGKFESTAPKELRKLKFPDQDFLNIVFEGRWKALSWRINALKTWRYWHTNMWRDHEVAVLHYIVDKPWAARVATDSSGKLVAGYKGDDGETHSWWWDAFDRWHQERNSQSESQLLDVVGQYIASTDEKQSEEMRAVGGGAQDYAKKWEGKGEVSTTNGKDDENRNPDGSEDIEQGLHGPILRKSMLGERGHGPVVRERRD